MANLFEKPIAANPMSEFVGLPMDFIDQSLQRRQDRYDRAKAEVEEQENSLLNLKYLPGDAKRHHELQAQYEQELDSMVENTGGDYSTVGASLDLFTRRLKRDISFGELGAQQNNYTSAMKFREDVDKRLLEGKASEEGFNMALQSIQSHKTSPTEQGTFTSFTGYTPSTIVDPIKELQDGADEITAKYDAEGMKYINPDLITQNLITKMSTNSGLVKAIMEKGTDPETLIKSVVADKYYHEVAKDTSNGNGSAGSRPNGAVLEDVGQPGTAKGSLSYTGGSIPIGKNIGEWFGADSWKNHKDWVGSVKGKQTISYMEKKTGTKFPVDGSNAEQSKWILNNASAPSSGKLFTRSAERSERSAINDKGQFVYPNSAVYNRAGELLEPDEVQEIQGSRSSANEGSRVTFVSSVVTQGGQYPPGTIVITAHDGQQYFQEPSDPNLLASPEYNKALIERAKFTNTGTTEVTLRGDYGSIPRGHYEVQHVFNTNNYILYEGGKPAYTIKTDPETQEESIYKVN